MPVARYSETPTGAINGVNQSFTLSRTPDQFSVQSYVNGLFSFSSVTGATLTMTVAPATNDTLVVSYTVTS